MKMANNLTQQYPTNRKGQACINGESRPRPQTFHNELQKGQDNIMYKCDWHRNGAQVSFNITAFLMKKVISTKRTKSFGKQKRM